MPDRPDLPAPGVSDAVPRVAVRPLPLVPVVAMVSPLLPEGGVVGIVGARFGPAQAEPAQREQSRQKHGGEDPGPLLWSKS